MRLPPTSTSTRMVFAPASSEFSSSSFTTEAGRSTTSPAAILFATVSASTRILPMLQIEHTRSWLRPGLARERASRPHDTFKIHQRHRTALVRWSDPREQPREPLASTHALFSTHPFNRVFVSKKYCHAYCTPSAAAPSIQTPNAAHQDYECLT